MSPLDTGVLWTRESSGLGSPEDSWILGILRTRGFWESLGLVDSGTPLDSGNPEDSWILGLLWILAPILGLDSGKTLTHI